ncbi:hypothetical protein MQC79_10910, partial [Lactococcus garvieae]|uniref:hypothetical protein n=1 Tax=Lactococcus garvieae TaxID=1363 RepID=UPI001F61CCC4
TSGVEASELSLEDDETSGVEASELSLEDDETSGVEASELSLEVVGSCSSAARSNSDVFAIVVISDNIVGVISNIIKITFCHLESMYRNTFQFIYVSIIHFTLFSASFLTLKQKNATSFF